MRGPLHSPPGSRPRDEPDWLELARAARFAAPALARLLGISLRQLERAFVESTGWPPQQWLGHVRLWDACALLLEGHSPKQFIENLGFKTTASFFHAFKDYHGWTRREYLVNHLRHDSPGFERLKGSQPMSGLIGNLDGAPPHAAALAALNALLARSDRFTLYYIRSPCRRKAPDDAGGQPMTGGNSP